MPHNLLVCAMTGRKKMWGEGRGSQQEQDLFLQAGHSLAYVGPKCKAARCNSHAHQTQRALETHCADLSLRCPEGLSHGSHCLAGGVPGVKRIPDSLIHPAPEGWTSTFLLAPCTPCSSRHHPHHGLFIGMYKLQLLHIALDARLVHSDPNKFILLKYPGALFHIPMPEPVPSPSTICHAIAHIICTMTSHRHVHIGVAAHLDACTVPKTAL